MGRVAAPDLLGCERAVPDVDRLLEEDLMFGNHTCFISRVRAEGNGVSVGVGVSVGGVEGEETMSGAGSGGYEITSPVVISSQSVFTALRGVTSRWFGKKRRGGMGAVHTTV